MSNSSEHTLNVVVELESFLYTPYGVGTLAGATILLTSFLWFLGCCIYCCCRRKYQQHNEEGIQEAGRELHFIDGPVASHQEGNGSMSSGYNTGPVTYSLISLLASNEKALTTSSMDSCTHKT